MAGKYNRAGLYNHPNDPRLIVGKQTPEIGWTVNMGHRFGPTLLYGTCAIIAVMILISLIAGGAFQRL